MSEDAILYRARMRAPETKFTKEEEKLLVGWVIYLDLAMQSSTTEKFREYDSLLSFFLLCFTFLFSFFTLSLPLSLFLSLSLPLPHSFFIPFFFSSIHSFFLFNNTLDLFHITLGKI